MHCNVKVESGSVIQAGEGGGGGVEPFVKIEAGTSISENTVTY